MRYFAYIAGALLNFSGIMGLAVSYGNSSLLQIVIGLLLIVIGNLTILAAKSGYKGGVASIIGAVLLFFGIVAFSAEIDSTLKGKREDLYADMISAAIFIFTGIMLLSFGHKRHVRIAKPKSEL